MRFLCLAATAAISFLNPSRLFSESALRPPDATVGSNLEAPAKIKLDEPAPDEGLDITLRSADPSRLRISKASDKPGAASVTIRARPGNLETQEFWLQAQGSSGTVSYTAGGPGFSSGTGTVTLAPSGIMITGPYRVPKFPTTTGAEPAKIVLYAGRLDSSLKLAQEQAVSADLSVEVTNSNASAGRLVESTVVIPAGTNSATTRFQPAGEGDVALAIKEPPGFSVPAEFATITALVRKPGIVVSDDLFIGQNLEVGGALGLGEKAPLNGLVVTLTSADPSQLLLSTSQTEGGSKSIQITIPAQGINAPYFLQALGNSGEVEYTATAPGFRSRTAVVKLTPSGIVLTPFFQGPPDEGQVLNKQISDDTHGFTMKVDEHTPMNLIAWTAQLDPRTHRAADITVQPLRAGMSVTIPVINGNPAVGKLPSQITITGGSDHGTADFTPASTGSTEISIVTPKNFTVSANATKVIGVVK